MGTKQWTMLTMLCCLMGGCATERAPAHTFVVTPQPPLTVLPASSAFPELEAQVGREAPSLVRTLGYDDYEVSVVLPQASQWRYVRDPRLRVVVRRETPLGIALRRRSANDRCVYLEPTVVQDRLGARDWGPLRIQATTYRARRMDCGLLDLPLASR